MALHKSLGEIKAMSYAEFRAWQLFYMLEPFGYDDREYRTAAQLAMIYNVNKGKGKAKNVNEFMRDFKAEFEKQAKEAAQVSRDELIKQIKKDFGVT